MIVIAATALGASKAAPAVGQPLYCPANGHYYERVDAVGVTWDQAKTAAENRFYIGIQGHLATLATPDENAFIEQQGTAWGFDWIGGIQLPGSIEPDQGWTWITGEPWAYTRWADPSEPNNFGGDEDVLEWRSDFHPPLGGWNDRNRNNSVGFTRGFVVEYEGPMSLQFVNVGNAGNSGELSGQGAGGVGPDRICGSVTYQYRIGKSEITVDEYVKFLNAVAATDTYGLYDNDMDASVNPFGCNIVRSGVPGAYVYAVFSDAWSNRPVNFVSWGDAARFANWLTNGQPTGGQELDTTEDGSYLLAGAISNEQLMLVKRKAGARFVLPSEDEWYKAAYHKNDGSSGNFWDFPSGTDTEPNNGNPGGDTGNSANFNDGDYSIGGPFWRTKVGHFSLTTSPYGTFDQGGNVGEWTEATINDAFRQFRGGYFFSFGGFDLGLHAADRSHFEMPASSNQGFVGLRIVEVFDADSDGVWDGADNCPTVANPDQRDCDSDGTGDACEIDVDSDDVPDDCDNCPSVPNPDQSDCDHDGLGDACDPDIDDDGVPNAQDVCPCTPGCQSVDSVGRPKADVNEDCDVNGLDIQAFTAALLCTQGG